MKCSAVGEYRRWRSVLEDPVPFSGWTVPGFQAKKQKNPEFRIPTFQHCAPPSEHTKNRCIIHVRVRKKCSGKCRPKVKPSRSSMQSLAQRVISGGKTFVDQLEKKNPHVLFGKWRNREEALTQAVKCEVATQSHSARFFPVRYAPNLSPTLKLVKMSKKGLKMF